MHNTTAADCRSGQLCLSGGCLSNRFFPKTQSNPIVRADHVLAYDGPNQRLVLFGGSIASPNGSMPTIASDAWAMPADGGLDWIPLTSVNSGPTWSEGMGFAMDSTAGKLLVHGGRAGTNYLSETWLWDSTTRSWANMTQQGTGPGALHYSSVVFDSTRGVFVHFGGLSGTSTPQAAGATFEFANGTWARKFSGSPAPQLRYQSQFAFDEANGVAVLFGGCVLGSGLSYTNDETWLYNSSAGWEQVSPSTLPQHPPGRCSGTMAYDPVRKVVTLMGGYRYETGEYLADYWEWSTATRRWTPGPGGVSPAVLPSGRVLSRLVWFPPARRMVLHGGVLSGPPMTTTSEFWLYGGE